MKEFTIIIPIYNEVDNISRLTETIHKYISNASVPTNALLVDDGSTDGSFEAIQQACTKYSELNYISFQENRGLSAAIKAGFDHATSEYVGYIDADLQTTPEDFEILLPYRKDYAMVTGIRQNRQDSFVKNMSSKIANSFRRMMVHDNIEDTGCPLKIFKTAIAKKIPFFNGNHRFFAALVQMFDEEVKQVPVKHFPREAGQAKFGLSNRLIAPFMDCFHVKWLQKRHRNYQIKN
ncbi:glycosyl transferase family 2 [Balneicella halophila]|uniref:Glycosyl transferase family 2 n=1 Tax=Balneicella halophila TaxID=1537566 RepID=A0A7L4US09_BALHA|nr:glycosyltransferase family 2 protein [Balneicella halophila]PVX51734.1 glycosyl transferase family 2 [Balneicella halophila]